MSYSIFYDKQFIKVDDKRVLPIVLGGDNNVYDAVTNRRARDFYNYSFKRKLAYTLDEMMEEIQRLRDSLANSYSDYDDKRFGWFCGLVINSKSPTFSQFKSFFKTGFEKSLTIEQIGTSIDFRDYERTFYRIATNTETLIEVIDEIEKKVMPEKTIYVYPNLTHDSPQILRRKYFPKALPKQKVIDENKPFYIVVVEGYGAFRKATSRGFRYAFTYDSGKKFATISDAKRKVKYLSEKFSGHTFMIKEMFAKEKIYV